MVDFVFRKASRSDYEFYHNCISCPEFYKMIYGCQKQFDIYRYIEKCDSEHKYVCCLKRNDGTIETVGFVHYYKEYDDGMNFVGGISPSWFNRGLGLMACYASIGFFFQQFPKLNLIGIVYDFNVRSVRMHTALGFKRIKECGSSIWFKLSKEEFYSADFARKLSDRVRFSPHGCFNR